MMKVLIAIWIVLAVVVASPDKSTPRPDDALLVQRKSDEAVRTFNDIVDRRREGGLRYNNNAKNFARVFSFGKQMAGTDQEAYNQQNKKHRDNAFGGNAHEAKARDYDNRLRNFKRHDQGKDAKFFNRLNINSHIRNSQKLDDNINFGYVKKFDIDSSEDGEYFYSDHSDSSSRDNYRYHKDGVNAKANTNGADRQNQNRTADSHAANELKQQYQDKVSNHRVQKKFHHSTDNSGTNFERLVYNHNRFEDTVADHNGHRNADGQVYSTNFNQNQDAKALRGKDIFAQKSGGNGFSKANSEDQAGGIKARRRNNLSQNHGNDRAATAAHAGERFNNYQEAYRRNRANNALRVNQFAGVTPGHPGILSSISKIFADIHY